MSRRLPLILQTCVTVGLFAVALIPLMVVPSMYQPYASQGFAFRILVELTTGAWLVLACIDHTFRPKKSWVLGTWALFVVVTLISNTLGVNPSESFWSNYQRMDGWITLIHLFAYTIVATSVLRNETLWNKLLHTSFGVSALVSLYGVMQLLRVPGFLSQWQRGEHMRIDATLGNPDYLGTYLLFHICLGAYLLYGALKDHTWRTRPIHLSTYIALILLHTIMILLTGSRGALLGLICGSAISLLTIAFLHHSKKVRRITVLSFLCIPFALAGLMAVSSLIPAIDQSNVLSRFAPSMILTDNAVVNRLMVYKIAWNGFKERPILGWGQENFSVVSFKHFESGLSADYMLNSRTHNIILQKLIDGGIIGLLSYLLVLISLLWVLWRKHVCSVTEASILTGLLVGYFVQNLFIFDTTASYLAFATILGYIAHKGMTKGSIFPNTTLSASFLVPLTAFILLASLGVAWILNIPALRANVLLHRALTLPQHGTQEQLSYFTQAIALESMGSTEAIRELSGVTTMLLAHPAVDTQTKEWYLTYTVEQLQLHAKQHPVFHLGIAQIYKLSGKSQHSHNALLESLKASPHNPLILSELLSTVSEQGSLGEAFQYVGTIYDIIPYNKDVRIIYAILAIGVNEMPLSDTLLAPIIAEGSVNSAPLIQAYYLQGQLGKVPQLLRPYMEVHPDDARAGFCLAATYYVMGDKENAVSTLQSLGSARPSVQEEIETFITQIQNETVSESYLKSKITQSE